MISIEVLKGDTTGAYVEGGYPARMSAHYDPGGTGAERVGAGYSSVIVLAESSPRLIGGFSFQSTDGQGQPTGGVVEGEFDVSREP